MSNEQPAVRPFADFLREHGRGRTHDELGEALHTLVGRVKDTGKKGSITLTVTVEPMKKDDRMVVVGDRIKIALPEHDRPAGVWFVGHDGNLVRNVFEPLRALRAHTDVDPYTGEITTHTAI